MANLVYQILVCVVVLVQFYILEGKEQVFEYTELNNNPGTNRREEIQYHSRVTRDITPSSAPGNITKNVTDHHKYYSSKFHSDGNKFWNDISGKKGAGEHMYLSSNSWARATFRMSFDFPYYGHLIRNFTATSGGFLNLGTSTRKLLTEIQYVAPLMAYFNPKLTKNASVSYYDDGNQFIVQWTNVHLHDYLQAGPFTFQCILKKDGTIMFVYKMIPIHVQNISSAIHPVKVGVSDSFHIDYLRPYLGKWYYVRTHFIYDEVKLNPNHITTGSAYILNPKPNCITAKSCGECMNRRMSTAFNCTWCAKIRRCSDGLDRRHYEWRENECFKYAVSAKEQCTATTTVSAKEKCTAKAIVNSRTGGGGAARSSGLSGGAVAAIVILLLVIPLLILGAVVTYAYLHPTSPAGLYLIEHNPRRWFQSRKENQAAPYNDNSVPNKVLA